MGAQSPWLIQPLPCRWNYHTWTVWSNVSWICLITLVPVCMKGSHLCFRHLLNHLKENDAQSWVFLFIVPVQTSAIWVKVHISDEVLPFGLCLTYLYWIISFHLPFCLQSHMIFCNNSFLSILPRWTGRNMCPSAVRGIGFLHGNCQAYFVFSNHHEYLF